MKLSVEIPEHPGEAEGVIREFCAGISRKLQQELIGNGERRAFYARLLGRRLVVSIEAGLEKERPQVNPREA